MELSATHIGTPERRDRVLLLSAVAQALLTLLGAASEACGLDRTLKANTARFGRARVPHGSPTTRVGFLSHLEPLQSGSALGSCPHCGSWL